MTAGGHDWTVLDRGDGRIRRELRLESGTWSVSPMPTERGIFSLRYGAKEPPHGIAFPQEIGRFRGLNEALMVAETWERVAQGERDGSTSGVDETGPQSEAAGFEPYVESMDKQRIGPHILLLQVRDDVVALEEAVDDGVRLVGMLYTDATTARPSHGRVALPVEIDTMAVLEVLAVMKARPVERLMDPVGDDELQAWRATWAPAPAPGMGR